MWNMTLTKLFNNLIKCKRAQINKHWEASSIAFRMQSTNTNAAPDLDLSPNEAEKILNVINNSSTEDLLMYSITKSRAKNLELHRKDNGPYNSLEDLLQVKGMTAPSLKKFYKSIINDIGIQGRIIRGLVTTPKVIDSSQKDVNTVLGVHVGQNILSWSLLNRDCEVLQWDFKPMLRSESTETILSLLQSILPIVGILPRADRYILQEVDTFKSFGQNKQLFKFYVEQSMIHAIILSHLALMHSQYDTNFAMKNVFILHPNVLKKIYGLLVGQESISTQYVLQKLLQENDEAIRSKQHTPTVLINTKFRDMYSTQSTVCQEQISWPLLIALAFMELIVHERPDMVVRNNRIEREQNVTGTRSEDRSTDKVLKVKLKIKKLSIEVL